MTSIHDIAQRELYKRQKRLKIALGNAENRNGVTQAELSNIRRKLDIIDYLIGLVNKEDA